MKILILISNRLLKLSGAIIKGVGYIFHFFFPNKRFTIPKISKPIIKTKNNKKIPKIIWQTNYTNKVMLPLYINYLINRLFSLDFEYRYMNTEDREEFIKNTADEETFKTYLMLNEGAAQADFWRIYVLNYYGGVYLDIDAHLIFPISLVIDKDDNEIILKNKQHYTNYFMASKPNNIILQKTLSIMKENINQRKVDKGVYYLTGPVVLNKALEEIDNFKSRFYRYTCTQGSFTNEYFQYKDKKEGKWNKRKNEEILKDNG